MTQIWALYRQSGSDRLEKQPTDLRRHHHYLRDGALDSRHPIATYKYATVTQREEYARIRRRPTRLLPRSVCTGAFTKLLKVWQEAKLEMAITNGELLKLGLRIKALRKILGRSQKDFSDECGLDRSYFGGVERGERNLTFFSLCQICTGLNCDIATITKGIPKLRAALK